MPRQARADDCPALALRIIFGLCVVVAVLILGATVARGTESWQVLLRHQLKEQQRCVLDKILFMREVPVGKIVGLEGRIRCTDTREFDFQREHANQKFTIRLCQPVVC